MKAIIFYIFTLACSSMTFAQQSPTETSVVPLPDGPLLNRAPDFSKWSVVTEVESGSSSTENVANPKPAQDVPQPVAYIKTGNIILEQVSALQIWHLGASQLVWAGGNSQPFFSDGGSDFFSVDFSKSDFSGMDWISPQTYTGVGLMKGRKCLIFQGHVTPFSAAEMTTNENQDLLGAVTAAKKEAERTGKPLTPLDYKFDQSKFVVPATVYIDLETRLPLTMEYGSEKKYTREYVFSDPPTTPLVPPPVISAAINAQAKSDAISNRKPAAP